MLEFTNKGFKTSCMTMYNLKGNTDIINRWEISAEKWKV